MLCGISYVFNETERINVYAVLHTVSSWQTRHASHTFSTAPDISPNQKISIYIYLWTSQRRGNNALSGASADMPWMHFPQQISPLRAAGNVSFAAANTNLFGGHRPKHICVNIFILYIRHAFNVHTQNTHSLPLVDKRKLHIARKSRVIWRMDGTARIHSALGGVPCRNIENIRSFIIAARGSTHNISATIFLRGIRPNSI